MQAKNSKGLKPLIIKYIAMLMGICYMMNPFQGPIHKFLHEVSHGLEAPLQIISHNPISSSDHRSVDHFDSISDVRHNHGLIDIVNAFFEASSEDPNGEEPLLNDLKIDKHITTRCSEFKKHVTFKKRQNPLTYYEQVSSKYIQKLVKPPQHLII